MIDNARVLAGRRALVLGGVMALLLGLSVRAASAGSSRAKASPEEPDGEYVAAVTAAEADDAQKLWNLTGEYDVALGAYLLELSLVHDGRGRITGTGVYNYTDAKDAPAAGGKADEEVPLVVTGVVKGKDGVVVASLAMQGTTETVVDKEVLRITIRMSLALDADGGLLEGVATVVRTTRRLGSSSTSSDDSKGSFSTHCVLDLPVEMDGSYTLDMFLSTFGETVSGETLLELSNGDAYPLTVRGKCGDGASALSLTGDATDAGAKGIRIKASVVTLDDGTDTTPGTAELNTFAAKLFGQALRWPAAETKGPSPAAGAAGR